MTILHNLAGGARRWLVKDLVIGFGALLMLAPASQMAAPLTADTWRWMLTLAVLIFLLIPFQDLRDLPGDTAAGRVTHFLLRVHHHGLDRRTGNSRPVLHHRLARGPQALTGLRPPQLPPLRVLVRRDAGRRPHHPVADGDTSGQVDGPNTIRPTARRSLADHPISVDDRRLDTGRGEAAPEAHGRQ
ncbi:hypothetical protein ABZ646_36670 [Streptomyces sp. NPDC007162]|uniref:hypothetical protein n=1 Tax=Streptomyces sp. NPDC007162 TaxID=3156917 RepID=UPI0033E0C3C1